MEGLMSMYIKRHLEEEILNSSKYYPVIMVCGSRQVGKSTMLNHIREKNRKYVSLDDRNARRLAETDPELFFETYAATEIIKSYYNAGKRPDLYYYRDIDRKEIDLLVVEGNNIYPMEIKKSKNPANPAKNFAVLKKLKMDVHQGLVICMANELIPYSRDIWLCPVTAI